MGYKSIHISKTVTRFFPRPTSVPHSLTSPQPFFPDPAVQIMKLRGRSFEAPGRTIDEDDKEMGTKCNWPKCPGCESSGDYGHICVHWVVNVHKLCLLAANVIPESSEETLCHDCKNKGPEKKKRFLHAAADAFLCGEKISTEVMAQPVGRKTWNAKAANKGICILQKIRWWKNLQRGGMMGTILSARKEEEQANHQNHQDVARSTSLVLLSMRLWCLRLSGSPWPEGRIKIPALQRGKVLRILG